MESVFIALLLIASLALGVTWLVFWAMRQIGAERAKQTGRGESLAEVEQAVAALIDRLTRTADDCLARIESARERVESLLDGARPAPDGNGDAAAKSAPPRQHPAITSYLETGGGTRAAQVDRLADQHLDEAAISRETGLSRDEVRLMLALRAARG